HLRLNPEIPLGAQLESASACGRHASVRIEPNSEDEHALLDLAVPQGSCDVSVTYRGGVVISMPPPRPSLGNSSTSAELTSVRRGKDTLRLDLDLIPDVENKIFIHTQERVVSATPAKLNKSGENLYELTMPASGSSSTYKHIQISVKLMR
ncbi:MAG TPA: hypothetical protein VJQ54_09205, partial [Candidatus Sulfotelmatobacter sp.]|nr:hypothetical protein [Candidatus Sulfotelmatobacter sp.]